MTNISISTFVLTTSKKQLVRVYPDSNVPVQIGTAQPFKAAGYVTRDESLAFPRLRKLLKPGHEARFIVEGEVTCDALKGEIMITLDAVQYVGAVNHQDNRKASGKKLERLFAGVKGAGYEIDAIQAVMSRRLPKKEG